MYLSKDKSILVKKIVSCLLFCLLFCDELFALGVSEAPRYIKTPIDTEKEKNIGPIANPIARLEAIGKEGLPINEPTNNQFVQNMQDRPIIYYSDGNKNFGFDYLGIDGPLLKYYNEKLLQYKSLNNYHEENYLYSNGQHGISYYDGILTKVIKDFDGDNVPEMALFKITTNGVDEFSNKEITIDMVRIVNGVAVLSDTLVISSEQYLGEEIECDISIKYVEDRWRIYLNYCECRVREQQYENKFIALEYNDTLNIINEINLSSYEDDYYDDVANFQDQIIDAGINIRDDYDIYKRAFLNDDMQVIPCFTIKRVNEKVKDSFVEDYFAEHYEEIDDEGYIKLRYGYTQFVDRI